MRIEKCNVTFLYSSAKAGGQNGGQCPVIVKETLNFLVIYSRPHNFDLSHYYLVKGYVTFIDL